MSKSWDIFPGLPGRTVQEISLPGVFGGTLWEWSMVHPASAQCPRRVIDRTSVCLQQGRHGSARGEHNDMKFPNILRILKFQYILERFLEKLTRNRSAEIIAFHSFPVWNVSAYVGYIVWSVWELPDANQTIIYCTECERSSGCWWESLSFLIIKT